MINYFNPGTIDEKEINKKFLNVYTKLENLTRAVKSAKIIGCYIINIDAHDLAEGTPHLVLGILWQIIRVNNFIFVY